MSMLCNLGQMLRCVLSLQKHLSYVSAVIYIPRLSFHADFLKFSLVWVFGYCQVVKLLSKCVTVYFGVWFFFVLLRTKNKAHHFMLLLIWAMSTLWTCLSLQVEKQLTSIRICELGRLLSTTIHILVFSFFRFFF